MKSKAEMDIWFNEVLAVGNKTDDILLFLPAKQIVLDFTIGDVVVIGKSLVCNLKGFEKIYERGNQFLKIDEEKPFILDW